MMDVACFYETQALKYLDARDQSRVGVEIVEHWARSLPCGACQGGGMNFEDMSDTDILEIATPIMDNLMEASTRIDYEAHVRDFSDRMRKVVTKEHLQKVCEQYQAEKGFFAERQPVAVFKRPESATIVWKQRFTKTQGEFVAEMVLVHQNGRYLCDHAMVF